MPTPRVAPDTARASSPPGVPTAADEYLSYLALEANRSPQTVAGYRGELLRFGQFLTDREHSLAVADLSREDLRAWLRCLAKERIVPEDLAPSVTLPKVAHRLPRPMDPDERARLLRWAALPSRTLRERRDRALLCF